MRLGIVIVSYNGQKWLEKSLGSCFAQAPGTPVYVVDNASTDNSLSLIQSRFPAVRLLPQKDNLGFAAGNNVGIRQALQDGAEAVLLLNQDAELGPSAVTKLEQYLAGHPAVAAVQPAIFLPDGRVNSLGNCFHYLGFGFSGGHGLKLSQAVERLPWVRERGEPPYLSGAAVLLRGSALQTVGLFDPELYLYHEDLELSLRLRLSGFKLALCPEAAVVHHYEFSRSVSKFYYMERNRWLVWLSYWRFGTLALLALPLVLSELMLLLTSYGKGWFAAKLKVYAYLGRRQTWQAVASRRRRLKSLRRVSDRQLLRLASATIDFQELSSFMVRYVFNPLSALAWQVIFFFIRW